MNIKKLRLILLGSMGVLVILFFAGCFLGLSLVGSQSHKLAGLKSQSKALDDQLSSLTATKKQVQQYSYIKTIAQEIIPNDKDQAAAVLEINQIASDAGINIQNISFPSSTLGTGSATNSLLTQAKPVSGIAGLYSIQVTVNPETGSQVPENKTVTYAKMLDFLDRIERNQRTAQITQVTVQPQGGGGGNAASSITFSLTLNIFIKP